MTNRKNEVFSVSIVMKDGNETTTYERSFEESPNVIEVFEAYLRAYESFGYLNDVNVTVDNKVFGESYIGFSTNNGVVTDCALKRYLDNNA